MPSRMNSVTVPRFLSKSDIEKEAQIFGVPDAIRGGFCHALTESGSDRRRDPIIRANFIAFSICEEERSASDNRGESNIGLR